VPRCMPSRLKCQQAAVVVVDISVFGQFRSSIPHALQNELPIHLTCSGN
jgi:hypothetical protein